MPAARLRSEELAHRVVAGAEHEVRMVALPRRGRLGGHRIHRLRVEEEPGRDMLQAVHPREAPALRHVVGPHGTEVDLVWQG